MLIPSIDLQGGRIVQLVQGEKLAIATDDFDGWIARFARFPKVQLIDLDAAKNAGDNSAIGRWEVRLEVCFAQTRHGIGREDDGKVPELAAIIHDGGGGPIMPGGNG